jgi:hypothetical protein
MIEISMRFCEILQNFGDKILTKFHKSELYSGWLYPERTNFILTQYI